MTIQVIGRPYYYLIYPIKPYTIPIEGPLYYLVKPFKGPYYLLTVRPVNRINRPGSVAVAT